MVVILISTILLILYVLGIIFCNCLLNRNNKVADFLKYIIELNYQLLLKGKCKSWKYYEKMPSYKNILFSFKKLELKTFFSDKEIKELKS